MKPVVLITWTDASDHRETWVGETDAEQFGNEDCTILSIGFLVNKTAKYYTLAADWIKADKDYGRVTKIPVAMVEQIIEIRMDDVATVEIRTEDT